jgi:2-polyprenyl-6-methoxyphenol hydroxylase-like FAD-dependent oxidoreductase
MHNKNHARAVAGSGFGGAVVGCLLSQMAYTSKLLEPNLAPTLEP